MRPPPARPRRCPICGKPPREGQRFCSERCQRIDLGRWLSGVYAVPVADPPPEPEEGP
jgi:endogenous inhibitor of DNA gyrase (YacG/DUF329 family)